MKLSIITLCLLLTSATFANKMLRKDAKGNPISTHVKIKLVKAKKDILGKKLSDIIESMDEARCEKIRIKIVDRVTKGEDQDLALLDNYDTSDKKLVLEIERKGRNGHKVVKLKMKPVAQKCDFSTSFK